MTRVSREEIAEWADGHGMELALYEPADIFDSAIVGIARRGGSWFVVYDEDTVLRNLAEDVWDSTTEEERADVAFDPVSIAREHYEFNTTGSWIGDTTPAFLVEMEGWSE